MKITPLDIRHKEFKRGLRGYSDVEVDEFLDQVAEEFERLFKENIDLKDRAEALSEKVSGYKRIEEALQKTLVTAQASAEEVKQNAATAAQLVLHEAELKARQMMNAAYGEKQAVEQATARLASLEEDFRFKFREMLQGYLKRAEHTPRVEPEPAVGVSEAQSDLARHADAIREAISREETAMQPSEAQPAPGSAEETAVLEPQPSPLQETEVAPAEEPSGEDTVVDPVAPVAPVAPLQPADPGPKAPEDEPSETSGDPERRSGEGGRILFGDRDGLLADVDSGVNDNEFKW